MLVARTIKKIKEVLAQDKKKHPIFLSELRPGGGKGPVLMKLIQTLLDCSLFDKKVLLALPNETL